MRFDLTPLIRVERVNGGDLGDRVDHMLRVQIGFLTSSAIELVMDIVSTMQIALKSEIGKSVAGAIELFHSGFEFLGGGSCRDQFNLYRQVNTHSLIMS